MRINIAKHDVHVIRTAVRQGTRDERERESKNSGCANWAKIPTKQTI